MVNVTSIVKDDDPSTAILQLTDCENEIEGEEMKIRLLSQQLKVMFQYDINFNLYFIRYQRRN